MLLVAVALLEELTRIFFQSLWGTCVEPMTDSTEADLLFCQETEFFLASELADIYVCLYCDFLDQFIPVFH